jgi:pre-mRNA-splicing factor SPF27
MAEAAAAAAQEVPAAAHRDALPYIDKEFDNPRMAELVHQLIEEEMATFTPPDYLAARGLSQYNLSFKKGSILATELARASRGQPMGALDLSSCDAAPPPKGKGEDLEAWKGAVRNAKAQLEHQLNRQLTLDLLATYGSNAWLHHNKVSQCASTRWQQNSVLQRAGDVQPQISNRLASLCSC